MKRRTLLGMMAAAAAASNAVAQAPKGRPIQLNCDLAVDPAKEQDFIHHFETVFRPVAMKHQGYIDLKLLKINQEIRRKVPDNSKFRFDLTFESEALRQTWIASDDHIRVWQPLEDMLTDHEFSILVYDVY